MTNSRESATALQRLSRHAYALTAGLIILEGAILRLHHLGRDLSIGESWVANSVLTTNLHEMFYYDSWLQTTPPLFLLLVRETVKLLGVSDYSLRTVPFAFSVLALFLLAELAGRMLRPPFAVICLALMALSPTAIVFSKELKQYSSDVAAACLILLALWEYLQHDDRKHYLWLLLAFALMLPLSYTAVVFVPLALLVLIVAGKTGDSSTSRSAIIARCAALSFVSVTMSGLHYFLLIRFNTSPFLTAFWQGGYPPSNGMAPEARFSVEHFLPILVYFYFPFQSVFKDTLKMTVLSLSGYIHLAGIVTGLVLAAVLIRALWRERVFRWASLFFLVPLLTLIGLNLARIYPVSSRRLTLFMLPGAAIVAGASLQALWQVVVTPRLSQRLWQRSTKRVLFYAAVTFSTVMLAQGIQAAGWDMDWSNDRGTESALRYLKSEIPTDPETTIYIHAALDEPARLYLKMLRWDSAPVRIGHTGWPCCKRTAEARPSDIVNERAYVLADFENAIGASREDKLWLLFTELTRSNWLPWVKVDERAVITGHLYEIGCRKESERHFESAVADEFHCTPP